jgi:hypothetical protein
VTNRNSLFKYDDMGFFHSKYGDFCNFLLKQAFAQFALYTYIYICHRRAQIHPQKNKITWHQWKKWVSFIMKYFDLSFLKTLYTIIF